MFTCNIILRGTPASFQFGELARVLPTARQPGRSAVLLSDRNQQQCSWTPQRLCRWSADRISPRRFRSQYYVLGYVCSRCTHNNVVAVALIGHVASAQRGRLAKHAAYTDHQGGPNISDSCLALSHRLTVAVDHVNGLHHFDHLMIVKLAGRYICVTGVLGAWPTLCEQPKPESGVAVGCRDACNYVLW